MMFLRFWFVEVNSLFTVMYCCSLHESPLAAPTHTQQSSYCEDWKTKRLSAGAAFTDHPLTSYCYWNEEGTGDAMETDVASARSICSCVNTCKSMSSRSTSSMYCQWMAGENGVSDDPEQCTQQCEKGWDSFDTPKMCGLQLRLEWMPMQYHVMSYFVWFALLLILLFRALVFQMLVVWYFKSKKCENCNCVFSAGARPPKLCNQCGHVYCPKCLVHERTILGQIHGEVRGMIMDALLQIIINPAGFVYVTVYKFRELLTRYHRKQKSVCSTCFATTTTTALNRLQLHAPSPGMGLQIEILKTYQKLLDTHYKATKTVMRNLDSEFYDAEGSIERDVDDDHMLHGKECSCFDHDQITKQHKISRHRMSTKFQRDLRRTIGVFWWMSTKTIDPKTQEPTTIIMGDLVKQAFHSLYDELNKEELLKTWVGQLFKWIDMNDAYGTYNIHDYDDYIPSSGKAQSMRKYKSRDDRLKVRVVRKLTRAGVFRPDFVLLVDQIISQVDNSETRSHANLPPPFLADGSYTSVDSFSKRSLNSVDAGANDDGDEGMRDTIPVSLENFLCAEAPAGVENDLEPSPGEKLASYFWGGMDMEQRGQFRKALAWYSPLALSRPRAVGPPPTVDEAGHLISGEGKDMTNNASSASCRVLAREVTSGILNGTEQVYRVAIFDEFIAFLSPEAKVTIVSEESRIDPLHIQDLHSGYIHKTVSKVRIYFIFIACTCAFMETVSAVVGHIVLAAIGGHYAMTNRYNHTLTSTPTSQRVYQTNVAHTQPSVLSARIEFDLDEHLRGIITRAEILRAAVLGTDPSCVQLFMHKGEAAVGTVKGAEKNTVGFVDALLVHGLCYVRTCCDEGMVACEMLDCVSHLP